MAIKSILIIIILILTGYTSFSQFNYGILVGTQGTNVHTDMDMVTEWRPAFHVGIFANYSLNKNFAIDADLLYTGKGFQLSYERSDEKRQYDLRYLNIPLVLKYNIYERFSVFAGGEFGLLLSSHSKYGKNKTDVSHFYGWPFDISLTGGVSYQINSKSSLKLRYIYGMSNILSDEAAIHKSYIIFDAYLNARDVHKVTNQTVQISVSYALRKSKNITTSVFPSDSSYAVSRLSFGVKTGLNLNNTYYRNLYYANDETMTSPGFHFGAYLQVKLAKKISIAPEIQFIQKGYKYTSYAYGNYGLDEYPSWLNLYYLEVPLMFSYSPSKEFSIEVGPNVGILFHVPDQAEFDNRGDKYTELFEFGVNAGLRINISEHSSINLRYYRGMTAISSLYEISEYNNNLQMAYYYKIKQW